MDYEKKYKNALTIARSRFKIEKDESVLTCLGMMFPELRESEEEVTRKRAIAILKQQRDYWSYDGPIDKFPPETPRKDLVDAIDVALSYLEKQKEQKPQVFCEAKAYDLGYNQGKEDAIKEQKPAWSEVELEFRGEKVTVKRPFYRDNKGRGYSIAELDEDVAWNALRAWCEKKGISLYDLYPKAEWSEEDKDYYDTIVRKLEVIGDDSGLSDNQIKFLREHCPSHRSEWNEEDETIIEGACSALEIYGHTKLASRLKSLRPQSQGVYKTAIENILKMCESYEKKGIFTDERAIDFLGNVRVKCKDAVECAPILDEPSWKPSEEQMNCLCAAVDAAIRKHNESVSGYEPARVLKSLYEDLQKL